MSADLKGCPFCGGKAAEDRDCAGFYNYRCTQCKCGLYGDYEHHMSGRAAWNRRATPAAPTPAAPEWQAEPFAWIIARDSDDEWDGGEPMTDKDAADDYMENQCLPGWHLEALYRATHLPRQAAVQGEDAARLDWLEQRGNDGGLLLHAGNQDTGGRSGLGLINTGRTLRQAVDSARGIKDAKSGNANAICKECNGRGLIGFLTSLRCQYCEGTGRAPAAQQSTPATTEKEKS